MSLRSEKPLGSSKKQFVYGLEHVEFENSPSTGSVRYPFQCPGISQHHDDFELQSQYSFPACSDENWSSRSEKPLGSDKKEFVYGLKHVEFGKSSRSGSVRYPFQCQDASQHHDNFEPKDRLSFRTCSGEKCGSTSMRSDYYVGQEGSNHTLEDQIESCASLGFATLQLDERSRQSPTSSAQVSQANGYELHSLAGSVLPDNTNHESIHDVKVKRRNIFREQLVKWNIIKNNQAEPSYLQTPITQVIDAETLVPVGKSKDVIYYYVDNGLLGDGAFGSVYKGYAVQGTEKTPVAVKFVKYTTVDQFKKDKELGQIPSEVFFLKKMKDHPNVIKFLHYQRVSTDTFVIICERPSHCKDLFDLRSNRGGFFTEYETKKILKTLVDIVVTMESKNIVHRDLKLENILYDFDKDDIKLIDFGLATEHKPGELFDRFSGTPTNIPPEFIKHKLYDPSKEAVRSLGVIIYEMLYGGPPYKTCTEIISRLPKFDSVSEDVKNILTKLFALDPKDRPSIKQVAKHSWFGGTHSFTRRMSSFLRGLFGRGSYNINHPKTANKFTNRLARPMARSNRPVSRPLNHGQPAKQFLKCNEQKSNHVQMNIHSQHNIYSERAIDVGDLVDSVTTAYYSAHEPLVNTYSHSDEFNITSFSSINSNHASASMYNLFGSYDEQHDWNNQQNAVSDKTRTPVQIVVFHCIP